MAPGPPPAEVLEAMRLATEAATGAVTASAEAPPELVATPAVTLSPADPFIIPNRRVAICFEQSWEVRLFFARHDLAPSLERLAAGYRACVAALHGLALTQIGSLRDVRPDELAGAPVISGVFTLTYEPP